MPGWLPREEYLRTLPQVVHSAKILVTDEKRRILLLHDTLPDERSEDPLRWWIPGGVVDRPEESPAATALRELAEETGLAPAAPPSALGVEFHLPQRGWPQGTIYYFSGGVIPAAELAGVRLSEEHDDSVLADLDTARGLMPAADHARLGRLLHAREHGTAYILADGLPQAPSGPSVTP